MSVFVPVKRVNWVPEARKQPRAHSAGNFGGRKEDADEEREGADRRDEEEENETHLYTYTYIYIC